ncbi:MAG: LCP family protein [Treponema sp.]|jgi:anionic cell wall polymer biosynthesis LytR-Cps2A-Psr (LCP) family protein|nr:LCP family protein [Treponema sp.]
MRKKIKADASALLLAAIALILAGGVVFAVFVLRPDPLEESLSEDRVINTLFVIENRDKPLCSYVIMYYPGTRRAAIFDIPGSLGLILQRINRVDRIDTVYDPRKISAYESEIEGLLGVDISFSAVVTLENLGKIVDLIEGVEIFIPSPVDAYQEEPVLFPSGVARLDGDKAKTYITYELQEENSELVNFRRQRFFLGFLKRLGERNEALRNPQTAQFYYSLLKTSMSHRSQIRLFDELAKIDTDRAGIQSVGGNPREVSGQTLIFPFWDGNLIKDIVRQSLGSLVRPVEGSMNERVFTVEVLNGTLVNGLAGRTAELLRGFGYDVISIGNADSSDYERTVIIDRSGFEDVVRDFGEIIHCTNIRFDSLESESPEINMDAQSFEYPADFTLILGRDFNERYVTGG